MKKVFGVLIMFIAIFIFISCENEVTHEEVYDEIEVNYQGEDNQNKVSNDFEFTYEEYENVEITFSSSSDVISIEENLVKINRKDIDVDVDITINIKINNKSKGFIKTFKILKENPLETLVLEVDNFTHVIGEEIVDYKNNFTATLNGNDVKDLVVVDDSSVNFEVAGVYYIRYEIEIDNAKESKTIMVTVKKAVIETYPTITGTKDFIYYIGDELPNYLEGVTATDNVEGELIVTVDDSLVDLETTGTYKLLYSAVNSSGNKTEIEQEVTVKINDTEGPAITGTKDFVYIIGDELPNYLEGVTATDNIDGELTVTVDESNVLLDEVGVYDLYYRAVDTSGNETIIETNVTVIKPNEPTENIKETFDNLGQESSSYITDSFIGVNGLTWSFTDSRTDQKIDGKAIAFDKVQSASLSVTLTEGLNYFSLDAKTVFSGSTTRNISLFIDGTNIETFEVTSDVNTFIVEDLNYQTEVLLEIKNTGGERVIIDNVVLSQKLKSPEETLIETVKENLSVQTVFITDGEIELLNLISDVNIVWDYLDEEDINNQYINLSTNFVTIPEDDIIVSVYLLATLSIGEFVREKTFKIDVGEGEPLSILDVRDIFNNSPVKTQGVITSSVLKDNIYYAFMQDELAGIYIESTKPLTVGEEVVIKAVKKTINGVVSLVDISDVKVKGNKTFNITQINLDELNNNLGKYIEITGFLTNDTTVNQTEYEIVSMDGLVNFKLPSYIDQIIIQNLLNNKEAGFKITLEGYVYNENTIYLIDQTGLYVEDVIDKVAVSEIILQELDMPLNNEEIIEDILLPLTDNIFNSTIEWISSNDSVLSNTGKVNIPDQDEEVTLYYEIKIGSKTVKSESITVLVLAYEPLMPYYQSASGKNGNDLLYELASIISNRQSTSYDQAKVILENSDRDPNNYSNVLLIYNRASVRGSWSSGGTIWNREHVWPQSKLGGAPKSEVHNLRPANPGVNSSRGNLKFARGSGTYGTVSGGWYPGDEDRGDVARIIFYMITLYSQLRITTMGSLDMFIDWHFADPVDDFERNRNDVIYSYTNNRNPYIDYPEFVTKIWDTNNYQVNIENIFPTRASLSELNSSYYSK